MPIKIKTLGYTLTPEERFADENDCLDEDAAPPSYYYNPKGNLEKEILDKIEEAALKPLKEDKQVPWIEHMVVIANKAIDQSLDKNQTQRVEAEFKQVTLEAVEKGLEKLAKLNIPFNRPSGFYADMIKSDVQMARVVEKIAQNQQRAQHRMSKRAGKVKKKFSKKVKQLQRSKQFTRQIDEAKKTKSQVPLEQRIDQIIKRTK